LSCGHCFDERHAATGDLPLEILQKVLRDGKSCGIEQMSFTGGEPTIHRRFEEIIDLVSQAGYPFSFVSNGASFPRIYRLLVERRSWFLGVTFSLDGAQQETQDRLRGKGSYRSVMRAISICAFKQLPFTFNMVLTAKNCNEIEEMVELAERLGSHGVRFGHLMPTSETALRKLDLTPEQRREVESNIWRLRAFRYLLYVPGIARSFHPAEFQEYGPENKLFCFSSLGPKISGDVIGNLKEITLTGMWKCFRQRCPYLADKRIDQQRELSELDHFLLYI
jgi:MoaA/NifB/PqqE/SkfB family radical SAM enzyme